jgi:hypothetical protein
VPKILLANPFSRAMAARLDDIPEAVAPYYDAMADRLLWTLNDGDAAVTPGPVKKDFLAYLFNVLDLCPDSISVLSLTDYDSSSWYPEHNPRLVADLFAWVGRSQSSDEWSVSCYIRDRDIVRWEVILGMSDASSYLFAQNLAELMNTKSAFRLLAGAAGFPIAEGRVVSRGAEMHDTIRELLAVTGSVIVKQDQNSGGDGNVLVTMDPDACDAGTRQSVQVSGPEPAVIRKALATVGLRDSPVLPAGSAPAKYVVEVFHSHALSFYAELDIPRDAAPRLCNYGDLRMSPLWSGFEIPSRLLTTTQQAELCAQSMALASLAQSLGYCGRFDCDVILTRDGRFIVNEFNGRVGGATHIDVLCERLIGPGYLDEVVLLTRNSVPSPRFHELMLLLEDHSLHVGIR